MTAGGEIHIDCPGCGDRMQTPTMYGGKPIVMIRCISCGTEFSAPFAS